MKRFLIASMMFSLLGVHGQENPKQTVSSDVPIRVFLGGGSAFLNRFEINSYLRGRNIVPLETREFNFTAGLEYYDKMLDIDLGYELFINGSSNDKTKNRTIANGVKLRALYKFAKIKAAQLGVGFNISYNRRKLSLFWKDQAVDFNDLDQEVNGNQLTFFMEKAYFGPAIAVIFDEAGLRRRGQMKLTLSYEIGLNNKKWEPQFFTLKNEIKESRLTNLLLNITFSL